MAEKTTASELISSIQKNLKQKNTSRKDETLVMQAMLSDPTYEVAVYDKEGQVGTVNPCKEFRSMCASVLTNTTKIPKEEAETLMSNYSVKKAEAESMVEVSKEFVNSYLKTGRKMSMGGREESNIFISRKVFPETTRSCPKKDENGNFTRVDMTIGRHEGLKVQASCPPWVKTK